MNCTLCKLHESWHVPKDGSIVNCWKRAGCEENDCKVCGGQCPKPHSYMTRVIDDFRGSYRFLSNFHLADVVVFGWTFASSEHAYQAMKAQNPTLWWPRFADRNLSCKDARKLGRSMPLRADWECVRLDFMKACVRDKFTRHQSLQELLCATDPIPLVEGNTWGDTYFGVCNGIGENWLGKILMDLREELWRPPF